MPGRLNNSTSWGRMPRAGRLPPTASRNLCRWSW
jgi:hypothetical protein